MGDPIVSPWFIYALHVIHILNGVIIGALIVSIVAASVAALIAIMTIEDSPKIMAISWRAFKWSILAVLLTIMALMVVPTKNEVIEMYIAKHVTYKTVSDFGKSFKSLHDTLKKDMLELLEHINRGDGHKKP